MILNRKAGFGRLGMTLGAAVLLVACQPGGPEESSVLDASGLTPHVEAYEGVVNMIHANGNQSGQMTIITRTKAYKNQNLIIEQTIQVDHADEDHPKELVSFISVDGSNMKITEVHDEFAGTGQFTAGSAWDWTKWTTKVNLEDDLVMDSTMAKTGNKLHMTQKLNESGELLFTFDGELTKITEAKFKSRYDDIFGSGGDGDGNDDF